MESYFITESTQFDIELSLALASYNESVNSIYFKEGAKHSGANFISKCMEAIKKLFLNIRNNIQAKIREVEFEKRCKELAKQYAEDQSTIAQKEMKIPDIKKYRKDADIVIKMYKSCLREAKSRNWSSPKELNEFIEKQITICTNNLGWNGNDAGDKSLVSGINMVCSMNRALHDSPDIVKALMDAQQKCETEITTSMGEYQSSDLRDDKKIDVALSVANKFIPIIKKVGKIAGVAALEVIGAIAVFKIAKSKGRKEGEKTGRKSGYISGYLDSEVDDLMAKGLHKSKSERAQMKVNRFNKYN